MKNKKDLLDGFILVVIGVIGAVILMLRVDQLDTKKELPVARQSNSANF